MIMSINRDGTCCEHEAARQLPWLVVGTLSEHEATRVREHIESCEICSADFQREQHMQELLSEEPAVEHAPQPGLQNLMSRIDELERELPPPLPVKDPMPVRATRRFGAVQWLAAAAIIQAVGIGFLGVLLWGRDAQLSAPRFHTMSAAAPAASPGSRIRVVFAPRMQVGEMQSLVRSIGATVVAGPTDAGVYTLAFGPERTDVGPALEALRTHGGVLFAEPQASAERIE